MKSRRITVRYVQALTEEGSVLDGSAITVSIESRAETAVLVGVPYEASTEYVKLLFSQCGEVTHIHEFSKTKYKICKYLTFFIPKLSIFFHRICIRITFYTTSFISIVLVLKVEQKFIGNISMDLAAIIRRHNFDCHLFPTSQFPSDVSLVPSPKGRSRGLRVDLLQQFSF